MADNEPGTYCSPPHMMQWKSRTRVKIEVDDVARQTMSAILDFKMRVDDVASNICRALPRGDGVHRRRPKRRSGAARLRVARGAPRAPPVRRRMAGLAACLAPPPRHPPPLHVGTDG